MAIEKKEVEYSKEIDDVMVLIVELIKDIKAKKDMSAITGENLANLIAAISGIEQAPAELKASKEIVAETVGYRFGELVSVFI